MCVVLYDHHYFTFTMHDCLYSFGMSSVANNHHCNMTNNNLKQIARYLCVPFLCITFWCKYNLVTRLSGAPHAKDSLALDFLPVLNQHVRKTTRMLV